MRALSVREGTWEVYFVSVALSTCCGCLLANPTQVRAGPSVRRHVQPEELACCPQGYAGSPALEPDELSQAEGQRLGSHRLTGGADVRSPKLSWRVQGQQTGGPGGKHPTLPFFLALLYPALGAWSRQNPLRISCRRGALVLRGGPPAGAGTHLSARTLCQMRLRVTVFITASSWHCVEASSDILVCCSCTSKRDCLIQAWQQAHTCCHSGDFCLL
ncbi:uncharacterized protein LOC121488722 [Vulpes lagopus]|uniref:uncharacterized protein LOC121488722 n=1 Tax=Vulpes lagopus TaxID=494514 RepID=UPI001BC914EE|nr:uncharacterized protein LOC121488722 [Vulpes lagopus]